MISLVFTYLLNTDSGKVVKFQSQKWGTLTYPVTCCRGRYHSELIGTVYTPLQVLHRCQQVHVVVRLCQSS